MTTALIPSLRGLPRTFWYVWAGALVNRLGGFVVPFLALYLTQERHFSVERAGFIVSLYGAGSLASGPVGGWLADRVGRRFVMILGLGLGALSMLHLAYARHPLHIGVATLLLGFLGDLYRPGVAAMIADLVSPKDRRRAYGFLFWAINLGFSLATFTAGLVSTRSFLLLFWADAGTSLAFAAIVWLKVPETRPPAPENAGPKEPDGLGIPLGDWVFVIYVFLNFAISTVFQQSMMALPLDMRAHGVTSQQFGMLIAMNGVLIVILQPFSVKLVEKLSSTQVLVTAALLIGAGFGSSALASTVPAYALTILVWTLGEITLATVQMTVVADLAPPHLRGSYQGIYQMGWGASALAGPAVGGLILGRAGSVALWLSCAGVALASALGQIALSAPRRRRIAENALLSAATELGDGGADAPLVAAGQREGADRR